MRALFSRLAVRIYVIGLSQIAVIALGAVLLWNAMVPRELPTPMSLSRYVADRIANVIDDPAALSREIASARGVVATVDVFEADGTPIVTRSAVGAPRCWAQMPADGATTAVPDSYCFARRVALEDGRAAFIAVKVPAWPPLSRVIPAAVGLPLLVIALSSLLLGRTLSHPLRLMSATARAFGDGNFDARVSLARGDELGEVAHAFDEMAERVADLLRAERELMANISHELRTPLARIRVAIDLAAEGDSHVARQSLKDIADDLAELERLIGDVLTVARLDPRSRSVASAIPALHRQRVSVNELVERAAARFRTAHPARSLLVDSAFGEVAVVGDPVLLRRVLDNLLENANAYTERPDATVDLRVEARERVAIHVVDRGAGIAPEDLKSVFNPFFRADRSRTRDTGGLGLGLVVVRRIVEAHGGTIQLESTLGRGTTATVQLPRAT